MAEAFIIAVTSEVKFVTSRNGRYERWAAECNDKPVYQLGGERGYVLFQPADRSNWMVGPSDHSTSCEATGYIKSNGNVGGCPRRPAGARIL